MSNLKLVVEILHASNLPPKDGDGSASAYVEVIFDAQMLRTRTKHKNLNPAWNEKLEFTVSDREVLEEECLEVNVYSNRKAGPRRLLGKAKLEPEHIRRRDSESAPVPIPIPFEKGWSIFTKNKGELFLSAYYYDEERSGRDRVEKEGFASIAPSNLKLVVEILHASNLPPKDGEGSASAYVEVSFIEQRQRTYFKHKDLNPAWNEKLEFTVSDREVLEKECIEVNVYTERKAGHRHLLGRAKVKPEHIRRRDSESAHVPIPIPLEKGWSIFTKNKGELFLSVYYYDEERSVRDRVEKEGFASIASSMPSEFRSIEKGPSAAVVGGSSRREEIRTFDNASKWESGALSQI